MIKKLEEDWSPEQIAGELKERCRMTIISHETIYQFIYSEEGRQLKYGTENVLHIEIRDTYEVSTHFCDPYCSWQKGLVEEINDLIRQYLPRHINMNQITQDQIYEIQEKLNNRPRKSLKYKTPNQVYSSLIESGRFKP